MRARVPGILAIFLLPAACGGGGGSFGSGGEQRTPSATDARGVVSDNALAAGAVAATGIPAFGSVTQSSNGNVARVTTDAASTTFDGRDVALTVRREDGSLVTLGAARHRVISGAHRANVHGHTNARSDALIDYSNRSLALGVIYTSWDNDDPADYLAGGYRLHAEDDFSRGTIEAAEVGASVDGPELSGAPSMPVGGTASYDGTATGLYAYEYGATKFGKPIGTVQLGDYVGDVELVADFGTNTISGCIGCREPLILSGTRKAPCSWSKNRAWD